MKKLAVIIVVLFASCEQPKKGVAIQQTNNPDLELTLLFQKDSCKVYRFRDDGRYVYWTDCSGKMQQTYSVSCGKNCTKIVHMESETHE